MSHHANATLLSGPVSPEPSQADGLLGHRASTCILLTTFDGRVIHANPAGAAMLMEAGHPGSLLAATQFDDRAIASIILARAASSGEAQRCEIRTHPAHSGVHHWQMLVNRIGDRADQCELLVELVNIDSLKAQEAHLGQMVERLDSALVNSMLGVWDHDFASGNLYYSDTWRHIRGIPPGEEVDGSFDNWIALVHPDDRARVTDNIDRQMAGELNYSQFVYRERHRAGHWVWVECRGSCVAWDDEGRPTRIVGTDTDVTDRKEAEERLATVSRRLELALDIGQVGVFDVDFATGENVWDDRLLAIYGEPASAGRLMHRRWEDFLHPEDRDAATARVNSMVAGGKPFSNQFRIVLADGSVRHIRARVAPVTTNGRITGVIGANWDVTDDVTVRDELERARNLAEARNRELEAAKARIEHDALHDFLTNLPNRRYLDETLTGWRDKAEQAGKSLAVMHMDLDRFKQINDTLGHQAGDTVLRHAARILAESKGDDDFIARIGGDEFVMLTFFDGAPDILGQRAQAIISRMCEPMKAEGQTCRIGASIGIAHAEAAEANVGQLLLNADIALYRAKERGRNRFEFFSTAIQDLIVNTRRLSDEILTGLEQGQFVPHYQLQFFADTLEIAGVETLARWQHPVRGLLTPDAFLKVAEDLDVMPRIDASMLDQALADLGRWRAAGLSIPRVSVNVSSRRLSDPAFADKIAELDMPEGSVAFELLESIFLDDCDATVLANLDAIRNKGIRIEIDDFGSGHASVVSLLRVGPGTFKIDRALIRPIVELRDQRKLVGSIVEIGRSLNIKVVAEGVETADHVRILRHLGCDILQGYALARPMSFQDVANACAKRPWRRHILDQVPYSI